MELEEALARLQAQTELIASLMAMIEELRADKAEARAHIERLTEMVSALQRKLDAALAKLGLTDPDDAIRLREEADRAVSPDVGSERAPKPPPETSPPPATGDVPTRRNGRAKLPEVLPRDEHVHRPETCSHCGSTELVVREHLVSERYDVVRAHVRARRDTRVTCTCNRCGRRTMPPGPPEPFERAGCTSAMLAWVVVMKLALHLPLERIAAELQQQGAPISPSTLATWFGRAGEACEPLYDALLAALLAEPVIGTDGTGLKVLPEGKRPDGRRRKALRGNVTVLCAPHIALYHYSPTKAGQHLHALLEHWSGTVVADAASTHDVLFADGTRLEAGCNAHGRRKFRDAEDTAPNLATEGGRWVAALYEKEREARDRELVADQLLAYRQEHIAPLAAQFRQWLEQTEPLTLPKSPIGGAVRYYLRHWEALMRFLEDPRVPIDNNLSERLLRAIAVGRRNYLYAGSAGAAVRLTRLASLVHTCKLNGVDPYQWLSDVLDRMAPHPDNRGIDVADLLPWAWKQARE